MAQESRAIERGLAVIPSCTLPSQRYPQVYRDHTFSPFTTSVGKRMTPDPWLRLLLQAGGIHWPSTILFSVVDPAAVKPTYSVPGRFFSAVQFLINLLWNIYLFERQGALIYCLSLQRPAVARARPGAEGRSQDVGPGLPCEGQEPSRAIATASWGSCKQEVRVERRSQVSISNSPVWDAECSWLSKFCFFDKNTTFWNAFHFLVSWTY